ncbi:MAG: exopolysaccharide biosynthesis polyprenyl glycosylphosphotransferase [Bergeyella zoohelcum]|nr:exopolysaccharide biosynthesis polyprenyl glycosylphosphotransferase [Bergeyella zoohelcum]
MQKLRYSKYFKTIFILLDIVVFALVFLFFSWQSKDQTFRDLDIEKNAVALLLFGVFWVLLSGKTRLYSVSRNLTYTKYLERFLEHLLWFILGILLVSKITNLEFIRTERFRISLSLFWLLFIIKSAIFFLLKYIRYKGWNHRNIMFLYENSSSKILRNTIESRRDYGYKIIEYPHKKIDFNELKKFWHSEGIYAIFIPEGASWEYDMQCKIQEEAAKEKIKVYLIPNIIRSGFFSYDWGYIESQPVLTPTKFPLEQIGNSLVKRIFDVLFSLIFLLFIGIWLFPILALLVKLDSRGPVFFVQKRFGYRDRIFGCIKFRTMKVNAESSQRTTLKNDERITPLGKFLRKTSLDETPQFINVLLGDMSVIGPRPHMLSVDEHYKPKINRYAIRNMVKPGITGLAQVNGLRGDKENMDIQMKKRILADTFYIKNWSLSLDFVIILKTLLLLVKGDKNAI